MNKPQLLGLALVSTLLLTSGYSDAAIYQPPAQDACGNYAAKAVYQFRNQRQARCGFNGARWNENGAGQHHWCRTVRPAVTEGETKARATQIMRCLNPGANINVNDMHLRTEVLNNELESAARRGAVERMQQLIAAGADVSARKTSLMKSAIYSEKPPAVVFLRRLGLPLGGAGSSPLNNLVYSSNARELTMVEFLLKHGVNPNHTNSSGDTPLRDAIQYGNEKMIALLLRYRVNPNLDIKGGQCKTVMPLDLAIDRGNAKIIQMLRRAGAKSQAQCQR